MYATLALSEVLLAVLHITKGPQSRGVEYRAVALFVNSLYVFCVLAPGFRSNHQACSPFAT
jgi:hypothetical protein